MNNFLLQRDDQFEWIKFKEVKKRVYNFRKGLFRKKVFEHGKAGQFVGLCSEQRLEWIISDLACIMGNITTIPIQEIQSSEIIEFIVKQSELTAVICEKKFVSLFIKMTDSVKNIKSKKKKNLKKKKKIQKKKKFKKKKIIFINKFMKINSRCHLYG